MKIMQSSFALKANNYMKTLQKVFNDSNMDAIEQMAKDLREAWTEERQVFICGNGGSAANALHMANDFHYGIGGCVDSSTFSGLRVEALSSNTAVLTCLANDTGYENIFSQQLEVKSRSGDLLIALSGSGNSMNVIKALEKASELGVKTFAILAFTGGRCMDLAEVPIHFAINDMQIAEDTQLIVGHICMQWLKLNKPNNL